MKPVGLKDFSFSHVSGRFPAQGSLAPGLYKRRLPPPNIAPVTSINAWLGPNRLLMRTIGRDGYEATVVRSISGRVLVVCRFPQDWVLDKLMAEATPTIEIVGSDGLSIECDFLGIIVETELSNRLVIRFRPRLAYILNTDVGPEDTWPAARYVCVNTGTGMIAIVNDNYNPDIRLRLVP